jgi:hypothetical protein
MTQRALTVIVPDDADAPPCVPSELDVASAVYGPLLPRSPARARWRDHAQWCRARAAFLALVDHLASLRLYFR